MLRSWFKQRWLKRGLVKSAATISVALLFARAAVFADTQPTAQTPTDAPPPPEPKKSGFSNFFKNAFSAVRRILTAFAGSRPVATPAAELAAVSANAKAVVNSNANGAGATNGTALYTVPLPPPAPASRIALAEGHQTSSNAGGVTSASSVSTDSLITDKISALGATLKRDLAALVSTLPTPAPSPNITELQQQLRALQQQVALSQRINSLTGSSASPLTISSPTITGASISGSSNVSGTLSGNFSGIVAATAFSSSAATSTVGNDLAVDTDTLVVSSSGNRVGIGTTTPTDTLSVNGPVYLAQITAPSVATDRLYNTSGSLYWNGSLVGGATVGTWTLSGSDVYRSTGNVGIGTTSPYTKLSVVGEVAARNFTATSTNATSTFSGAINMASTTEAGAGIVLVNGNRFIHNYGIGNTFVGLSAGNTTLITGSGFYNNGGGQNNTALGEGALSSLSGYTSGYANTAVGYHPLYSNTTGYNNTAVGFSSLSSNTTGYSNTALGTNSLLNNTTGFENTALGYYSFRFNTTGRTNVGLGSYSLYYNTTGYQNTASGAQSLNSNTTGYDNTAVGYQSLFYNTTGRTNVGLGSQSLIANTTGIRNTASGYNAGRANTTGRANTFLGYNAGNSGTTATISSSTAIGYEAQVATSSSLILGGTGAFNTWVGTGTTSPSAKFSIGQPANTSQGGIWQSATDGDFRATYLDTSGVMNFYGGDGGTLNTASLNAAGAWTNASDLAYKENIVTLEYGLETLRLLTPHSYTMKGSGLKQIGFVAQELGEFVPEVVSGEDGSKGISYGNLVSVVVKAVQELDVRVSALASTTVATVNAGASALSSAVSEWVGEKITATLGVFKHLVANTIEVNEGLVVKDRTTGEQYCVTISNGEWLKEKGSCGCQTSADSRGCLTSTNSSPTTNSAPVVTLNGNNPAEIEVGANYIDLGATVTDDKDQNLGLRAFVNGELVGAPSQISIDTSTTTTHLIDYVATDQDGNTATSTRTVIVKNQQQTTNNPQPTTDSDEFANGEASETDSTPPADDNTVQSEPQSPVQSDESELTPQP